MRIGSKKKQVKSFGDIIDMPIEEFDLYLKKSKFSMTELLGLKKGLELQYQRVVVAKDRLIELSIKHEVHPSDDPDTIFNQLYIVLQLIEDRVNVINQYIEDLKMRS